VDVMTGNPEANFQGYRLLEPLGPVKGCDVFKAISAQGDEIVAIKIFPLEIGRNRSLLERLRSSIQSVSQIKHSSILPIQNFGVHAGRPYIVTPFMESGSLQNRIEFGALQAMNVEVLIGDLVSALEAAHAKGIVHGNLKPSNILFNEEGNVQLNGLAETALRRSKAYRLNTTQDDSFDYRAPEVKAGSDTTPLADQYSLGLIALQMLTSLPIEVASTALDMIRRQGQDQISSPSPFVLDLPKRMIAVLMQALSGDPSQRFPSVRVMFQAFVAALHNEEFRLETNPKPQPKAKSKIPTRRKRSRLVILAPVIALALLLVVAIPVLSSGSDGFLSNLVSIIGLNRDGNATEVIATEGDGRGGVDLGTAETAEKDTDVGGVSNKVPGISATPAVSESSDGAASDATNTQPPPAKTDPPDQPAGAPTSPDQPTETVTPTPTILVTETATSAVTATELPPTDPPASETPIDPARCNKKEGHKFYCTPTP
jgi:serine/threonine protein kinase